MSPPDPRMPPIPRDIDDASFSELVPIRSSKIKLQKSFLFYVAVLGGLFCVFGFTSLNTINAALKNGDVQGAVDAYSTLAHAIIVGIMVLMCTIVYLYCKPHYPFWVCLIPAVVTVILLQHVIFDKYYVIFDQFLPGHSPEGDEPADVFPMMFVHAFFGPGLREELLKQAFTLFAAWLTFQAQKRPDMARSWMYKQFHLTGPLDGVILAVFSGAGFVFNETGGQYGAGLATGEINDGTAPTTAFYDAMSLMIPRVLNGFSGHLGYALIFGYFIGLAVIRPRHKWKLMLIGWAAAATAHGAWDGMQEWEGNSSTAEYIVKISVGVFAVGCLLKARQLETLITGKVTETMGSIVVERAMPMRPAPVFPGAPGVMPRPMMPLQSSPPRPAPTTAPAAAPPVPPVAPAGPPSVTAAIAGGALMLDVDGLRIPLRGGGQFDLGAEPALGGRGAGARGLVVAHPSRANVLGLRNIGVTPWDATLRDGTHQAIAGDKNVRLAPGVRIDFGNGLRGAVVLA